MLRLLLKEKCPALFHFLKKTYTFVRQRMQFLPQTMVSKCIQCFKSYQRSGTKYVESDLLFETDGSRGLSQWVFHDEDWIRVKRFREYQELMRDGLLPEVIDHEQQPTQEVSLGDNGEISFGGNTTHHYEWLFLYLDPVKYHWDNYSWKFRIKRETRFREFQFAFRYQDLYNRCRVRFENDQIYFDKVIQCKFFNGIVVSPFPMEMDVWYDIRLDIYEDIFRCYVDGRLMLEAFDGDLSWGSIAIILWEDDGKTNIRAMVSSIKVHKLLPLTVGV